MLPIVFCGLVLAAEPTPEDRQLAQLFQTYLTEEFRRHPVFATAMGNHEFDDRLDDLSPEARARDLARTRQLLQTLPQQIDYAKLSRSAQIDFEIWTHNLKYQLWLAENDSRFAHDPRVYGEYHTDSVFSLLTQSTQPKDRVIANAAKRITSIPDIIRAAKVSLKNPPRVLTEIAISRTAGAIAFYEKQIFELAGTTPGTGELAAPCRAAVAALQEFQQFLKDELLPRSTGEWRLGREKFSQKLELELDAGLTAAEVIAEAKAEADRVEAEMYDVAVRLWPTLFGDKPRSVGLPESNTSSAAKSSPEAKASPEKSSPEKSSPEKSRSERARVIRAVLDELGKDHGTAETFVMDAQQTVDRIREFIRAKGILTLPEPDRCRIIAMPEFQRGFSAAYLSPAPPLDPKADSLYAVAPPPTDWLPARQEAFFKEYNRAMLQILTIHEAYPGHYVQLEYSNRHPSLIRKVFPSGVFAEGWAVYTERMMLDTGYGAGDLSLKLHQLKFYIRAVINAILDYEMHCNGMTDEQALRLLMDRGFQTEGEAIGKIQRAKQSSCQLSTYFVGRLAFHRLRQAVEARRGADFRLGAYHEEVLSHGTLPVKYLQELVK